MNPFNNKSMSRLSIREHFQCEHFQWFEEFTIFDVKSTFQRRGNLVIKSKIFFLVPLMNTLKNVTVWLTLSEALRNSSRARKFWAIYIKTFHAINSFVTLFPNHLKLKITRNRNEMIWLQIFPRNRIRSNGNFANLC